VTGQLPETAGRLGGDGGEAVPAGQARGAADAIPTSNYGQDATNDPRIPKYVLPWLDRHFRAVFGGDYLDQGRNRPDQIPGRFSPKLSYRISMGPRETLPGFHCRLLSFVSSTPIPAERRCSAC